ncbi:MAG: hypothetical protein PUD07_02370 [bacterium]|nr:hypothetical protein [bacterium]
MILDIITYNYTNYYSFFFLNYLNKKNIYLIIFIGLIIDNIITNTYIIITAIMIFLYFIDKYIKNYYFKNIINYIIFIIIICLIFKSNIFLIIKKSILLQLTSIILNRYTYI